MSNSLPIHYTRNRPPAVIISTLTILQSFLTEITPGTTLYIDLEGANLSRHGTITLLTAHLQPQNTTYLIDVQSLGHATFTTPTRTPKTITKATRLWSQLHIPPTTTPKTTQTPQRWHPIPPSQRPPPTAPLSQRQRQRTLQTILQDPTIEKCLWDARADADALYWLHGVRLAGVYDLQLLEFFTRPAWGRGKHVKGLAKCVEGDLLRGAGAAGGGNGVWRYHGMTTREVQAVREAEREAEEWLAVKRTVKAGLGKGGGAGDAFAKRPLRKKTVRYCVGDVVLLPRLRALYRRRAAADIGMDGLVLMESWLRVEEAITKVQCDRKDMALGPMKIHY